MNRVLKGNKIPAIENLGVTEVRDSFLIVFSCSHLTFRRITMSPLICQTMKSQLSKSMPSCFLKKVQVWIMVLICFCTSFPLLNRVRTIILNNNRVSRIAPNLGSSLPHIENLILTNNRSSTQYTNFLSHLLTHSLAHLITHLLTYSLSLSLSQN